MISQDSPSLEQELSKKEDIDLMPTKIGIGSKEISNQKEIAAIIKSSLTKNETKDKEISKKHFMKKLLKESKEFTYYTPYIRKISFSKIKEINLDNTMPQVYLNSDKKSRIAILNSTKEKLENLKTIFGNMDSAINSLYDFFVYIEYCVVKGNDAK